jgi:hypothetical protein
MTESGFQAPPSSVMVPFTSSSAAKVQSSGLARLKLSPLSSARSVQASKAPPPRPQCITLGAVLDLRTTTACEPQRSNNALLTVTYLSPLRAPCGAAKRGR